MRNHNDHRREVSDSFVLVPKAMLDTLLENTQKILSLLEGKTNTPNTIGDYLAEQEAQKMLGRKTTWFWNMRKLGQLAFTKVGNKIFYAKNDIIKLLNNHRVEESK